MWTWYCCSCRLLYKNVLPDVGLTLTGGNTTTLLEQWCRRLLARKRNGDRCLQHRRGEYRADLGRLPDTRPVGRRLDLAQGPVVRRRSPVTNRPLFAFSWAGAAAASPTRIGHLTVQTAVAAATPYGCRGPAPPRSPPQVRPTRPSAEALHLGQTHCSHVYSIQARRRSCPPLAPSSLSTAPCSQPPPVGRWRAASRRAAV